MSTPMRIALAKGRLHDPAAAKFAAIGIATDGDPGRRLLVPSSVPGIEFLQVKPGDVPVYVESGAADIGVTGTDVLREANPDVLEPLDLQFGACRLSVAMPERTPYPLLDEGRVPRVATKYPRLAREFFAARGLAVEIIQIGGSVEVAPLLGLAHWIVDLVDTGNTLRANGLVERDIILQCTATLVVNRAAHKLKLDLIEGIIGKLAAL
jgi:ATP phosphoribosyltransferase